MTQSMHEISDTVFDSKLQNPSGLDQTSTVRPQFSTDDVSAVRLMMRYRRRSTDLAAVGRSMQLVVMGVERLPVLGMQLEGAFTGDDGVRTGPQKIVSL